MKSDAGIDFPRILEILDASGGRDALLETEGLGVLEAMGFAVPRFSFLDRQEALSPRGVPDYPGDKVVVKVVSAEIFHKSDVGGVEIIPNDPFTILATLEGMAYRFSSGRVDGFLIEEFIPYPQGLGYELLLGMRWTEDFGPVVTFGLGGIYAEFLSENLKPGRDLALFSPWLAPTEDCLHKALQETAVGQLMTGSLRGQKPRIQVRVLAALVRRFLEVAERLVPECILELEINPLVLTRQGPLALDVILKKGHGPVAGMPAPRPLKKIAALLQPQSVAIIGVSSRENNVGRMILRNLLREGFDPERIHIVKPEGGRIDGCPCDRSIADLPDRYDLFIDCVSASQTPQVVEEVIRLRKAESMIVIPGGLEEKEGGGSLTARMLESLKESRQSEWQGPVINGGNCLGIRSIPGCYDTFFIPEYKLPRGRTHPAPLALIAQSGAFAISRLGKLAGLNPMYCITCGNQTDLTFGDYLEYFKEDPGIEVVAAYIEGFKKLDGIRFLKSAAELSLQGRSVIIYRAGRTASGAKATASHTASIAGDYVVTERLAIQAGVVVVDSIEDFEDLVQVFALLRHRPVNGWKLGAVSNAGFECVTFADRLGGFEFGPFHPATIGRLNRLFSSSGISQLADIHNPLDLTPMANDEIFSEAVRALLDDPLLDAVVVGCTPLTAALQTLPAGDGHTENMAATDSLASRLIRLWHESVKPWVIVIDGGPVYDPLAQLLRENGIPVFRIADRAIRLFHQFFLKHLIPK